MRRSLPLLFAVLATACATTGPGSYNQAVGPMVPPVEAPMVEPIPSFPHPGYTPNGAGLPGERVPGPQGPEVKRSSNTRVLDDEYSPNKEPGLWAADGAPQASQYPLKIAGVPLSVQDLQHQDFAGLPAETCVAMVEHFINKEALHAALNAMDEHVRECFVIDMFHYCNASLLADRAWAAPDRAVIEKTTQLANKMRVDRCADVGGDYDFRKAISEFRYAWRSERSDAAKNMKVVLERKKDVDD